MGSQAGDPTNSVRALNITQSTDNNRWLYLSYHVYTIQPAVKPVECLYTRYNQLSNQFDNRHDNRLYRVKGALVVHCRIPLLVPALRRQNQRYNEELKQREHNIEITEMQCKRHGQTASEDDCAVDVDAAVF